MRNILQLVAVHRQNQGIDDEEVIQQGNNKEERRCLIACAAAVLTCFRGALPPVLLRAVCFVRAMVVFVSFSQVCF